MIVNDALVEKLANLARLELKEEEKAVMKDELEKMIGFIEKLNELDTSDTAPLLHVSNNQDIFREDKVEGQITSDEVFRNAPLHGNGFFKVPKVIKK